MVETQREVKQDVSGGTITEIEMSFMFYNAKYGHLKTDAVNMDYISFGKGGKALLLIQGLSIRGIKGSALSLAYMYRIFAKDYRVYVFDRRHDIPDGFSAWDIADDILYAMKELGIEKADVFGVSQGGMIAQALAVKAPDMIGKIVLGVTLSRPNETVKEVIGGWIAYAEEGDYQSINREMFTLMYSDAYLKKYKWLLPLAIKYVKPDDLHRFIILAKSCITFDAYDRLDKIKSPVLVLGGCKDKITTGEASEEIAEKLNCSIYMYEQYGHAAYDEAKDFNMRVLKFLKGS